MTRDYAKRSYYRKKSQSRKGWVWWLVLMCLFVGLTAYLTNFNIHQLQISKLLSNIQWLKKPTLDKSNKDVIEKTAVSTPKFNFYNIARPSKTTTTPTTTYELEIATVNDFAAADHMKAELALLGFAANITPIYRQGTHKHQISIGPYTNMERVNRDQRRLKMHKINSSIKTINLET